MSKSALMQDLDNRLAHQNKWRYITSGAYFGTTASAIICSGSATVVAALGSAKYAAILAGATTILLGLEKAMMFREKWAHHLRIWARLDSLRLQYLHGSLDDEIVAQRLGTIVEEYSVSLPIEERSKKEPQIASKDSD